MSDGTTGCEESFLAVKKLAFSYDARHPILKDISFSIAKGETLAVLGASGSGKSTLLRLLAGLLSGFQTQTGRISIAGQQPEEFRREGRISFMFQEPALIPHMTVEQNIALPLTIRGRKHGVEVDRLLEMTGMIRYRSFLPSQLSGGMKARVALARSFVTQPRVLLMDEPFTGLDVGWKSHLYHELGDLVKKGGTTTVLVTHDLAEAQELADEALVLSLDGTILSRNSLTESAEVDIRRLIERDHAESNHFRLEGLKDN